MKRWMAGVLLLIMTISMTQVVFADVMTVETVASVTEITAASAVLIELETGNILYEQNADEIREPASVTKIMTMLLVLEAVESGQITLDDVVTASQNAKEMGGSQINLDVGEQMTVYDLMMSVAVASANDAAMALAEYVAGSEAAFVSLMNQRALELGMTSTSFQNPHGLTEDGHTTTAADIAIMTAALLQNPFASTFLSCETYTIRADTDPYQMRTTNALLSDYAGCVGGKTGYTETAGYCMSVAATQDGMTLIAVVMGCESSEMRTADLECLLDYGFANYESYSITVDEIDLSPIAVSMGMENTVDLTMEEFTVPSQVIEKGSTPVVEQTVELAEQLQAPVYEGMQVGTVKFTLNDTLIYAVPIVVTREIAYRSVKNVLQELLWRIASL